jgi:hypothetical protein
MAEVKMEMERGRFALRRRRGTIANALLNGRLHSQ